MKLRQAHQILIGSAIGLAALMAMRSAVLYFREHAPVDAGVAVGSLAIALALLLYLRRVRAKWSAGTP